MSISPNVDLNSNASDFDQSDEDLASLLGDDDEDILKKTFSSSPAKKKRESLSASEIEATAHLNTGISRKDSKVDLQSSLSPKRTLPKSRSKEIDDPDSDALNDILSDTTLPSLLKKTSPFKKNPKEAGSQMHSVEAQDEEEDVLSSFGKEKKSSTKSKDSFYDSFFKNLSSPKDSPEKSSASSSLNKKEKVENDGDDILESLKTDEKIPSQKRKDSYLDSFLKNISPKTSPKKSLIANETRRESIVETKDDTDDDDGEDLLKSLESDEEKSPIKRKDSYAKDGYLKKASSPKTSPKKFATIEKKQEVTKENALDSDEEDIFGKSPSLETKKSNPAIQKHSTPDKRKTFIKQVSFKGIPDNDSPDNTLSSPKHQSITSESVTKPKPPKRSERMGVSNKDNTDWLNFFKESPKSTQNPTEPQVNKNVSEDKSKAVNFRSVTDRRRSSSAEWLGLSESDLAEKDAKDKLEGAGDWEPGGPVKAATPQSTSDFSATKKLVDDPDLSWLNDNKRILRGQTNRADYTDLSFSEKEPFKSAKMVKGGNGVYAQDFVQETGSLENAVEATVVQKKSPKQSKVLTPFSLQNAPVGLESQSTSNVSSDVSGTVRGFPSEQQTLQSLVNSQNGALSLQPDINNHPFERDQFVQSSEAIKQMYEERIKTFKDLHNNELQSLKESMKMMESKLKLEMQIQFDSKEAMLSGLQREKKQIEEDFRDKLKEIKNENLKEIERLKELHRQSIASMKQDHEDALLRLNRLKEQEIEAVLSSQTYSKSLQHLTEQLEARASELASLQIKVEERNQATMKEKQALLETKERDLKNLQSRVERQLDEGDSERSQLQQLVLRLESRLQKYTIEGEEDRWEVQQMKARLSVQQKHLDEEYKLQLQQVEREKEKLRLAQDSLLHEQKTVLVQLAQERQQLVREKMDMESVSKKLKEEESIFHVKKMKEESYLESQKQFLQQEANKLCLEKNNVKQEADMLEREQESLQRERHLLNEEKLKINEFNFKLKRRETEAEMKAMSGTEDRERAQVEHALAVKIRNEQQSRMQEISCKLQEVMEKEQQLLTKKEKLSEERLDLENKRKTIVCNKCKLSLGIPVNAPPHPQSIGPIPLSAPVANLAITNGVSNNLEAYRHDPSLVVWYITAQRDREYLQEELAFLKSLKDSSSTRKRL